ncbi:MAG: hypothetical protein IT557_12585 [Alphaproteobacteria bacterium]|nr:hypothetical protein [Alphaproteobacteria bacterium]
MKDLFPYDGLSPPVLAALEVLEAAERLDGNEQHYRLLLRERERRIMAFLVPVMPVWGLGFLLVWGVQAIGWLPESAPWAYAFGPLLFMALVMARVRPNAMRDDLRVGRSLSRWKGEAEARGIKP